jgi:hypothetical protein
MQRVMSPANAKLSICKHKYALKSLLSTLHQPILVPLPSMIITSSNLEEFSIKYKATASYKCISTLIQVFHKKQSMDRSQYLNS